MRRLFFPDGGWLEGMLPTPASLLQRLRAPGERRAWDEFVELYTPLLFHWARRAGVQEADAADLVQDVFVVLVRKLPEFEYDPARGFRGWLRTITLNKWRERLRKRAAAPAAANHAPLEEVPAPPGAEPFWETEYRQLLTRRLLEVMRTAFQPTTWKACWETAVEGRSAAEVGGELNLSPGAVRAAKFRVLCRLQAELEGLLD
jgi:RNA polymerase sigma-70 factor, ECF subfamily